MEACSRHARLLSACFLHLLPPHSSHTKFKPGFAADKPGDFVLLDVSPQGRAGVRAARSTLLHGGGGGGGSGGGGDEGGSDAMPSLGNTLRSVLARATSARNADSAGGEAAATEAAAAAEQPYVSLDYLTSFDGMGEAVAACRGRCECATTALNAHTPGRKASQRRVATLRVSQLAGCKLLLAISPNSTSAGHRFKLLRLAVGMESA